MIRGGNHGLTAEDGRRVVELARESVHEYASNGRRVDPGSMRDAFYMRAGALVRLETANGRGRLRGSASAHEQPAELAGESRQLGHAVVDAAVTAASDASRDEVRPAELPNLRVSVFTIQAFEACSDPESEIEVGGHGLAVEAGDTSAWMYPTVPADQEWSVFEFLDRTARKAGLPQQGWEDESVTVVRLAGQVFEEREPAGSVTERLS